jgi:hypothetical protein
VIEVDHADVSMTIGIERSLSIVGSWRESGGLIAIRTHLDQRGRTEVEKGSERSALDLRSLQTLRKLVAVKNTDHLARIRCLTFLTVLMVNLTSCVSHAVHSLPPCGFPARSTRSFDLAKFLSTYSAPSVDREIAVITEVLQGNIPDRLRQFETIDILGKWRGASVVFEIDVAPDYLMIGDDLDFVRMPLTNSAAQVIASSLGLYLPTAKLVDTIYFSARTQLEPQPTDWYKYPDKMRLGPNYLVFNATIEKQRGSRAGLIAGHKKDVIVTQLLDKYPNRVAIYGWHQKSGRAIQPLAAPHDISYEDYSHGIRFIAPVLRILSNTTLIASMSMQEAYQDPEIGPQLNGGTRLADVRAARSCTPELAKALGLKLADCPPAPRVCP